MSNEQKNKQVPETEHQEPRHGNSSGILDYQEINNSERDAMKGDTVGETLYSAKWILNSLLSLSKVYEEGWNESIENELCTLWDMTAEKDVVEFLLDQEFFKMAEFTLKISEEPRLTEIIVGIVGNMCCQAKSLQVLLNSEELVSLILSLVTSDDKETLIQVLRILQAALWDVQKNPESLWLKKIQECEIIGEAITFILKSSTSDELLTPTIDLVYLISQIELPSNDLLERLFNIDQLVFALCESITELISQEKHCHSEAQLKNIESWFNILFNIMELNLLKLSESADDENFNKINNVLIKILEPYEESSNLMLLDEQSLLCIHRCIKLTSSFQTNEMFPPAELIHSILKVTINLKRASSEQDCKDTNDFKDLYLYAARYWKETLENINKQEILKILRLCQPKTVKDIETVTTITESSLHSIDKFLEAKSMLSSIEDNTQLEL
ncbi:protein saal1 isoform X2 [Copidosoma floridanum]|nr:protein saal1 isoform X2 [Copidosoma floridanum]